MHLVLTKIFFQPLLCRRIAFSTVFKHPGQDHRHILSADYSLNRDRCSLRTKSCNKRTYPPCGCMPHLTQHSCTVTPHLTAVKLATHSSAHLWPCCKTSALEDWLPES